MLSQNVQYRAKIMRRGLRTLCVGAFAFATFSGFDVSHLLAQAPQTPVTSRPVAANDDRLSTLAIVNGKPISRDQIAKETVGRYGLEALDNMINRSLIEQECQRRGIQITKQDITAEIDRMAKRFNLTREQWLQVLLENRKMTEEKYAQWIWTTLSLRALARDQLVVPEEDIQKHIDAETGPQVQVRMISLSTKNKAEEVLALAKQNPADFGRLAKDYSEDRNSAAARGLIPPIRRHLGDPVIEATAFQLKEGEISEIVEIANQFIIMQCERQLPGQPITAEMRQGLHDRISGYLLEKKLGEAADSMLSELVKQTQVVNVYADPELDKRMPGVVAIVGQKQITARDLAEDCISRHGEEVLQGEITRTLLRQKLDEAKIEISEAELHDEIGRAALAMGFEKKDGTPDIDRWLQDVLDTEHKTVDYYVRDAVWPTVALKKLVSEKVEVTEDDLMKGFEANYGEKVEVLAIVSSDQRRAQRVWQEATKTPTMENFQKLAATYSEEEFSKWNNGKVPPIQRFGGRETLENEAFNLKPGEISGLIQVEKTWIILYCLGRTKTVVANIDSVRDELYKHILEQKTRLAMANEMDRLMMNAHIENFLTGETQLPKSETQAPRLSSPAGLPFKKR